MILFEESSLGCSVLRTNATPLPPEELFAVDMDAEDNEGSQEQLQGKQVPPSSPSEMDTRQATPGYIRGQRRAGEVVFRDPFTNGATPDQPI